MDGSRRSIHLWLTFYSQLDPLQISRCGTFLSAEEWSRHDLFYSAKDRLRYLVTRALVRSALSQYLDTDPQALRFSNNKYGRPRCSNPEAEAAKIVFNVSHTDGLIVLAVARHRALGVDVEDLSRFAMPELAERYFAPEESAALAGLPLPIQSERFFEYWTLKESYIKAREKGLSIPLDQFSFRFVGDDLVQFATIEKEPGDVRDWRFWQFRATERYVLSLCAQDIPSETTLTAFAITPGEKPKPFAIQCRRRS